MSCGGGGGAEDWLSDMPQRSRFDDGGVQCILMKAAESHRDRSICTVDLFCLANVFLFVFLTGVPQYLRTVGTLSGQ